MPQSKSISNDYASSEKLPLTDLDARERRSNDDVDKARDGFYQQITSTPGLAARLSCTETFRVRHAEPH